VPAIGSDLGGRTLAAVRIETKVSCQVGLTRRATRHAPRASASASAVAADSKVPTEGALLETGPPCVYQRIARVKPV
jgi:hypothetical protein